MSMNQLRELVLEMKYLQAQKDEADEKCKSLNAQIDALRLRKIPELMAALEVRNCTFEGIGRVQLAEDIYANTREGQKDAGIQWLRDCGYDGMVTEGYNASSVKALFRRMIADAQPIPDEIFNVTPFTRASIVKA